MTAAILALYWNVATGLVRQWTADDNYSHGFVIVPLAAYFAWNRRERLRAAPLQPSAWGLAGICVSVSIFLLGTAAAELFLARISLIPLIASCIWFVCGPAHVRVLRFPLLFLLLMIPLPAILFNQLAFPLQLFASQVGEVTLRAAGVPVLREGNVLELETLRLEVAEACSGIRSLVSLLTVVIVLTQVGESTSRRWWLLVGATVPVAIAANAARVAGTGIAAHAWGREAAEGFLHTASGTLVFVVAVTILLALHRLGRPAVMRSV